MMSAVDPLLQSVAASPRAGEYSAVLLMPDGLAHAVLIRVNGTAVELTAGQPAEWSSRSPSYLGLVATVLALDAARAAAASSTRAQLHDVDGGWDVSLGNVVRGPTGAPT